MPLAPVVGLGEAEVLAGGGPHPVGGDHGVGPDLELAGGDDDRRTGAPSSSGAGSVHPVEAAPLVDLGTGLDREVDQGRVEFAAPGDGGELAAALGQREPHELGVGAGDVDVVDRLPARDGGRVEAEFVEVAQRPGGEAVPATLVAGKDGLVDHHHVAPGPGRFDGGGGPRRPGADDHEVGVDGRGGGGHEHAGYSARRPTRPVG